MKHSVAAPLVYVATSLSLPTETSSPVADRYHMLMASHTSSASMLNMPLAAEHEGNIIDWGVEEVPMLSSI
jgi:hypothetical protein